MVLVVDTSVSAVWFIDDEETRLPTRQESSSSEVVESFLNSGT